MKRILCYGDSNTWGYIPGTGARHEPDVRWTGVAQRMLGNEYVLIEEGMNGRTTVFDNPYNLVRNGSTYLLPCLLSQKPLDAVVLMLGTNDLRWTDAHGAADGARALIKQIRLYNHLEDAIPIFSGEPQILLVSPIRMHSILKERENPVERRYPEESERFAKLYEAVAREMGVDFLDAALYAQPSPVDGVHMDAASHASLAKAIAEKLRNMMQDG